MQAAYDPDTADLEKNEDNDSVRKVLNGKALARDLENEKNEKNIESMRKVLNAFALSANSTVTQ